MRTKLAAATLAAAAASLALAGCATGSGRSTFGTSYGPRNLFGGYSDKEIEPGVWKVTGAGNGFSGEGFGRNVAIYRAAEIAKAHGFAYLQVLDQHGKSRRVGMRGSSMSYAGEDLTLIVRGTNDPAAPLACRAKKDAERVCATLPVATIIARIGPQLTFRKNHPPAR